MIDRTTLEIDGKGVIHQYQDELYSNENREDSFWPIAINHDSQVISFRLPYCTPETLRAAADLLELERDVSDYDRFRRGIILTRYRRIEWL